MLSGTYVQIPTMLQTLLADLEAVTYTWPTPPHRDIVKITQGEGCTELHGRMAG